MGSFGEALTALPGKDTPNLSPSVVARLRDLFARRCVCTWADGAHLQARMGPQAECTARADGGNVGGEERQWPDRAIARATPCLLGLLPFVTLLAGRLTLPARRADATSIWHRKQRPTFSGALAAVRRDIWREQGFVTSRKASGMRKLRPASGTA